MEANTNTYTDCENNTYPIPKGFEEMDADHRATLKFLRPEDVYFAQADYGIAVCNFCHVFAFVASEDGKSTLVYGMECETEERAWAYAIALAEVHEEDVPKYLKYLGTIDA